MGSPTFFRILDALTIFAALSVACGLTGQAMTSMYPIAGLAAGAAYLVTAQTLGLYQFRVSQRPVREYMGVVAAWLLVCFGLLLLAYGTKTTAAYSRLTTAAWATVAPAMLMVGRYVANRIRATEEAVQAQGRRVAIAGMRDAAAVLAQRLEAQGKQIHGYYDDRVVEDAAPEDDDERRSDNPGVRLGPLRGTFDQLIADTRNGVVQTVYIALPLRAEGRIRHLVEELADTTADVHVVAEVLLTELMQARLSEVGGVPVVSVFDTPFSGLGGWVKRVEDILVGTLILLLISIPMLVIALGVKLTSRGPVLFRQRRYGLNGEEITVLKFRSMTVLEDGAKVTQARKGDARITPFGAFLRRTSLDELPQFLHVITGKMSIVGPRPHAVAHNEEYRRKIRGYMLRHKVKPGITGWAQVNGWRGETDTIEKMQQRVSHDLAYINNWGLWLDLKIIFLTVFGQAVRKNAY